jgi:hypothetical protein
MADLADDRAAGRAALSICESLLIAMQDLKIMSERDARDVLQDAATAHQEAGRTSDQADLHKRVAGIIDAMFTRATGLGGADVNRSL